MKIIKKLFAINVLLLMGGVALAFTTVHTNIKPSAVDPENGTATFYTGTVVVNQSTSTGALQYQGELTGFPNDVATSAPYKVTVDTDGSKTDPIFYGIKEDGCYFEFSYNTANGTLDIGTLAQNVPNRHCVVSDNMIGVNASS